MSSVTGPETIINGFVDEIRPSFDYTLAGATCSGCLSTLLVVLLGFSTKESRRRVVFQLNVLAICIALTLGILTGLTSGKAVVDPYNQVSRSVYITSIVFTVYPPLLYDSILLTRLFALYPIASTPSVTLVKIFAFPFCVKCARVVALALFLNNYVKSGSTTQALVQSQEADWYRNPKLTAEWTMQMADNLYSVSFFLYNLHMRTSLIQSGELALLGGISERIRQIFYISVANFVFPLIFNIAQIILISTDRSPNTGGLLLLINNYVTVIGVLCATLWFSGSEWVRSRKESSAEDVFWLNPNLGGVNGVGRKRENEIVVIGKTPDAADFARRGSNEFQASCDTSERV
ncbi:hypothetical protein F5J12DRAFT_726594 [Pisolithus orientalis]|uniref:uncharacterized protein n=1 Tax=Pisolithus orientalis TaxID=936130 RepID=UPI002225542D|nr:uncharacterized protein F5J12DRAFT_726594 [Pisolithus orientalis]KAI5993835.1 hypothetical protein F5J12DRAFT_726594 [Pisolithus orientalis]